MIDNELNETQYIVEMDNRMGSLVSNAAAPGAISFIDDDNIASYYFSLGTDTPAWVDNLPTGLASTVTPLRGPAGTTIQFKVQASTELRTSTYLFEKLGSTDAMQMVNAGWQNVYYIDTTIKITGATTGYTVDVPVRYIKKKTT